MAGIIEKIAKSDVALLQPSGAITDGQYDLDVITGVKALVLESVKQGYNEFGQVIYGKVFLVAPLPKTPVVPGYIRTVDGTTYSIASVKPYRNMAGTLLGYRIAVAGVLITAYLMHRKVAGSILIGILTTWILG